MTFNDNHDADNNATANRVHFDSQLPDINQPKKRKFTDVLPILLSCRVRLNDTQREQLKKVWRDIRANEAPQPMSNPGSTVRSYSAATTTSAEKALNTSSLIISDLISTRDTIALTTIIELERVFGIELLSKEAFMAAAENYYQYNKEGRYE
ncbi:hypothetical protein [Parasynechococcus marenigrum]|uniref:Uncharacterized protein n=1 Tax=Parasynechococcus marenigrum (strain WH8102) TaxID=84588 RepID=Q7U725_PARMW|nr:hypothetical protein [Parasynechococcus marenigrum]CAE07676.1 hypothetical [Parasynechococcus marenigrum WH 8102]